MLQQLSELAILRKHSLPWECWCSVCVRHWTILWVEKDLGVQCREAYSETCWFCEKVKGHFHVLEHQSYCSLQKQVWNHPREVSRTKQDILAKSLNFPEMITGEDITSPGTKSLISELTWNLRCSTLYQKQNSLLILSFYVRSSWKWMKKVPTSRN